jgi:AraC-like DNA-binding protein
MIRQSDADDFVVNLAVSGRIGMTQQDQDTVLNPGDFAVYDSARPCRIACPGPFQLIVLKIPRDMFTARCLLPPGVTLAAVRGGHGMGALFPPFVHSLAKHARSMPPEVGQRLSVNTVELLATALSETTADGARRMLPRAAQLMRARRYITEHLADPDLSPPGVAQALRVSVRYLHLLFRDEDTSPARWILERRLEQATGLLADPRQAGRSVTEIAFSVGFKDASHFTRAFKSRHGLGPREYRRDHGGLFPPGPLSAESRAGSQARPPS